MATSIKIEDDLKVRILRLAELRQQSARWIMREAIAQYVEREEGRECFKQEALASWTSFKETGRHRTGQGVCSWLKTWGTEAETKLPNCHE